MFDDDDDDDLFVLVLGEGSESDMAGLDGEGGREVAA